jgi:FixJ family two-component response regulator
VIPSVSDIARRRSIGRAPEVRGMRLKAMRMPDYPLIAIVDDDEAVRIATGSLLRSFGYRTRVFASATEFLAAGMDRQAACLITDVRMPGMDGMELQQTLIARNCAIPILFMSAYSSDTVRQRVLAAGAACLLEKPFDSEVIIRHLRDALKPAAPPG